MKINFAKKIVKISAVAIFSVFILVQVFFANFVYAETVRIDKCGISSNGECVVTTTEYKEDGKEITQVMEIPMVEGEEGRVTEEYTNSEGKVFYRRGTVNTNEEITYMGEWKTAEDAEAENTDPTTSLESLFEDPDKYGKREPTDGEKFIYTLLQPLPQEGKDLQENVTLEEYLTWTYKFVLALAGFLAVMMIVIGGVEYIISGANESMREEAKKRISNAIWGLVMALAAYLVLYTINPSLVDFENNQFFKTEETTDSEE